MSHVIQTCPVAYKAHVHRQHFNVLILLGKPNSGPYYIHNDFFRSAIATHCADYFLNSAAPSMNAGVEFIICHVSGIFCLFVTGRDMSGFDCFSALVICQRFLSRENEASILNETLYLILPKSVKNIFDSLGFLGEGMGKSEQIISSYPCSRK